MVRNRVRYLPPVRGKRLKALEGPIVRVLQPSDLPSKRELSPLAPQFFGYRHQDVAGILPIFGIEELQKLLAKLPTA